MQSSVFKVNYTLKISHILVDFMDLRYMLKKILKSEHTLERNYILIKFINYDFDRIQIWKGIYKHSLVKTILL